MNEESSVSTEVTPSVEMPAAKPKVRKLGKKAKAVVKAKSAEPVLRKGYVALKTILAELDLPADGKLARRKLRAQRWDWHGHNERWVFSPAQAKKAREILTGGEA